MTTALARDALAEAAAIGPYFAVELDPAPSPAWLPFTGLLHDRDVVSERVSTVRGLIAQRIGRTTEVIDVRAGASIHFLGLASRLVAPALAAASLRRVVPVIAAGDVRWQRTDGGPVPIAYVTAAPEGSDGLGSRPVGDVATAAAALHEAVVAPLVTPLVAAFGGVSPKVLWGNVASALVGATTMLLAADTDFALAPDAVAAAVLERGPLAGTGRFDVDGRFFRRTSCCLFYRIPGAGLCGDCVLG